MAGDWIKMRCNLWDDPRVARLCDLTGASEASIIGALYWLWASADQHSEDGAMPGLSTKAINRKTGVAGFAEALVNIGWLEDQYDSVMIVRFDEHNGASAKRRCSESRRKMSARDADRQRTDSGQDADDTQQSCAPREDREKIERREERGEEDGERPRTGARSPPAAPVTCPHSVPDALWRDFLAVRKAKRAAMTQAALDGIEREATKAGISIADALRVCCERGWQSFRADWDWQGAGKINGAQGIGKQAALEARNLAAVEEWIATRKARRVENEGMQDS